MRLSRPRELVFLSVKDVDARSQIVGGLSHYQKIIYQISVLSVSHVAEGVLSEEFSRG